MGSIKYKQLILIGLKWLGLSLLMGVCGGLIGAAFSHSIRFVTELRLGSPILILFFPVAGVLSVLIYKIFKVSGLSTESVFDATEYGKPLSYLLAPAVFFCSALSHLCGASVGREGAALQLGGGLAELLTRGLKLNEKERKTMLYCGMAAVFSAVFGTPVTAFIFVFEAVSSIKKSFHSLAPAFFSSIVGFFVAVVLKTHPEKFEIGIIPKVSLYIILRVLAIALLGGILSMLFCYLLQYSKKILKSIIANEYLRIILGGLAIIVLTVLVGNQTYNGAGTTIIAGIFHGTTARPEAFILKLVFTVVAVSFGYKGGEIVPTLFIGATFGCTLGFLFGLPIPFCAALGMIALFSGATNCPLSSFFLAAEMFGYKGILFFLITSAISFIISGKVSLYKDIGLPFLRNKNNDTIKQ